MINTQRKAAPVQEAANQNASQEHANDTTGQSVKDNTITRAPLAAGTQLHRFLTLVLEREASTLDAEKHIGTTRVANLATAARQRYGLMLPCRIVPNTKPDGTSGTYGIYEATSADKERIKAVLDEQRNHEAARAARKAAKGG